VICDIVQIVRVRLSYVISVHAATWVNGKASIKGIRVQHLFPEELVGQEQMKSRS